MKRYASLCTIPTAIATVSLLAVSFSPALADEHDKTMEEITVQAPINIQRDVQHSARDPMVKTEVIELKREVYIGDLDLSKHADVMELEARIEKVAQDSCSKLNDMFPLSSRHSKDARRCVKHAIESAMAEKTAAIAAAQ